MNGIRENFEHFAKGYTTAKHGVNRAIGNFLMLRSIVSQTYVRYANLLCNLYGDRIRQVDPRLFDFQEIEYLDAAAMLESIEGKIGVLLKRCNRFIASTEDSFTNAASNALAAASTSKSWVDMAINVAANFVDHAVSAWDGTKEIEQMKRRFDNEVKRDITLFKTDLGRLMQVFRILNDVYIPMAKAFAMHGEASLGFEFEHV